MGMGVDLNEIKATGLRPRVQVEATYPRFGGRVALAVAKSSDERKSQTCRALRKRRESVTGSLAVDSRRSSTHEAVGSYRKQLCHAEPCLMEGLRLGKSQGRLAARGNFGFPRHRRGRCSQLREWKHLAGAVIAASPWHARPRRSEVRIVLLAKSRSHPDALPHDRPGRQDTRRGEGDVAGADGPTRSQQIPHVTRITGT